MVPALRSVLRAFAAIGPIAWTALASAQTLDDLAIQSDTSYVQVLATSGVVIDLPPAGPVTLPFAAQAGATSSLRAALGGSLRVGDRLDEFNPFFDLRRPATAITPIEAASWLPGLPATPAVPAPASIAVAFGQLGSLAIGTAALRDFSVEMVETAGVEPLGADRWAWPKGPFEGPLAPVLTASAIRGALDLDVSFLPAMRSGLSERVAVGLDVSAASRGTIERSPGGGLRFVFPIHVATELGARELATALPVRVKLDLAGRIVAQNPSFVPEPALGAAIACLALAVLARRRGGVR